MSSNRKNTRKLSFLGFGTGTESGTPGTAEDVQLDDEMEKVFARDEPPTPGDLGRPHHLDSDYELNRKRSFGQTPQRSLSAARGSPPASESDFSPESGASAPAAAPQREFSGVFSDESEPQVSERAASLPDSPYGSPGDRRVQFERSDATIPEGELGSDDQERRSQRKRIPVASSRSAGRHHHHHHHSRTPRKYSLQEEPRWRRVSAQPEDAALAEADLEQLDSHRSDDARALRRPRIQSKASTGDSTVHIARKEGADKLQTLLPSGTYKKMYDHSPHAVFVQLDELLYSGEGTQEQEWKETARWIKYEEDVEEGSARWGKPHVASLSFHSLLNLRRCLETGVVLLDLDEKDLPGVAYRVVEQMVIDELIEEDDKPVVMRSLLLRHRHVEHDRGFRFSISGRGKHSSYTSLQSLWVEEAGAGAARCSICSATFVCRRHSAHLINLSEQAKSKGAPTSNIALDNLSKNGSAGDIKNKLAQANSEPSHRIDMKEETYTSSQEDLKKSHNESIMKRIPDGAEATTVLVGAVGFLDQPTIAFVRLAQGIQMPSITEVPVPVRFMFILLGPSSADLDYHEVGRSISTLMSNPAFHKIAYKADDRRELLSAINEFLDDSIVLPPGDWERQALLPFDELKAKSDMIRRRKKIALEKKQAAAAAAGVIPPIVTLDEQKKALLAAEGLPPEGPPNPLDRTGRLFGGLINDAKRRYPLYVSDFLDGLNGQCVAASIFMYFAALSSAIAFGGLYADKTKNLIGISETLIMSALGGIFFALIAGQPMMVVGSTGPLLLFDESLYNFCISNGFDYLLARVYMGVWMAIIAVVVAAFEGSMLVKKFTRFTEDIFASLISLIFIMEPITKLISIYQQHPLLADYTMFNATTGQPLDAVVPVQVSNVTVNGTAINATIAPPADLPIINQPNTALFCTLLTLGTFIIAYYLRIFRNGKFLGRSARRALGDFGVPIAIVLMVLLDFFVPQTYTEKLSVPDGLNPTLPGRPWVVIAGTGDGTLPVWAIFAMVLPALMVYIIVFMETHIAELIVDKPERNLTKGSGFHMDIVVISLVNMLAGFMGAPWMCVATVRSVTHVSALTIMSTTHAPGEKPYIIEVKEQRMSALLVSILVGASVAISSFLRLVPMSVLFGVFLYMGISSLNSIQLFDRIILLLMPVKHHPQVPYVRRVPTLKMHLFTVIQILCIALLWTVKSTRASLAFPFFLILMVPLRTQIQHLFTPLQLRALDGKNQDDKDDEPDFYEEAPLPG